jgi:hypothetical protein
MAIIVVGLMSAVGPALRDAPGALVLWLGAAIAANFGMQMATALVLRRRWTEVAGSIGIVAGNRNIALFLVALPGDVTDPILLFIGCYQIPMYLTPVLLRRFHAGPLTDHDR